MSWPRRALLAAIALAALSLWLPWVWHRSAALVLSGLDLPEFAQFMGEVRRGEVRVEPLAFLWPVVALALACALAGACRKWSVYARLLALAFAVWLLALAFPPLEKPGELLAFAPLAIGVHIAASARRWPRAFGAVLLVLMALTSASAPLAQFAVLLPALRRLYGAPLSLGAGVYLDAAALLVGVTATAGLLLQERPSPRRYAKQT